MSFQNKQTRKIDAVLEQFRSEIIKTDENPRNNSGYAYLSSGRENTHYLKNGNTITEGLSFIPSKAATLPYLTVRNNDETESAIMSYDFRNNKWIY